MLTQCLRSHWLHRHAFFVNIFAETKNFAKLFSPVQIGPRSNLLSTKIWQKTPDTVPHFKPFFNLWLYSIHNLFWEATLNSNFQKFAYQKWWSVRFFFFVSLSTIGFPQCTYSQLRLSFWNSYSGMFGFWHSNYC